MSRNRLVCSASIATAVLVVGLAWPVRAQEGSSAGVVHIDSSSAETQEEGEKPQSKKPQGKPGRFHVRSKPRPINGQSQSRCPDPEHAFKPNYGPKIVTDEGDSHEPEPVRIITLEETLYWLGGDNELGHALADSKCLKWWNEQCRMYRARNRHTSEVLGNSLCGWASSDRVAEVDVSGAGAIPWAGGYHRVYPLNPWYTDPRDEGTYAAQGYGIPMTVPLAPNVNSTYNYSWGIPSSRLTPISRSRRAAGKPAPSKAAREPQTTNQNPSG